MKRVKSFLGLLARVDARLWLLIGFVLMCCAYEYGRVFASRPFPHHLSRQTSCLSMTYNLYMGEGGLFEPWFHNFFADHRTSGRSAGEFTGLYWFVAQIWKLTGPREDVYRLVMLLLHFAGTWSLFLGFRKLLGHAGWAVLAALFFFASPVMAYFAVGFITDVPAFDLALIGCWVLLRRYPSQRVSDVVISAMLFALAGLLKVTALMAPLALFIGLFIEWFMRDKALGRSRLFPHRWTTVSALAAAFSAVLAWSIYSHMYNARHGAIFSNQDILPIWALTPEQVRHYWECGRDILVFQIFDTPTWCAFLGMLVYVIWARAYASRALAGIFALLAGGTVVYTLLWWETLDGHEYYYVNPLITLVVLMALFLDTLRRRHRGVFSSAWAVGGFALLVSYGVLYAANNHEMRTRGDRPLRADMILPLYHEREIAFWDYIQHWDMRDMLDLEPYNRSIGIGPDDLVIELDDRSVCAALYLMRQRGWVQFGEDFSSGSDVQELIDLGASYLFVVDPQWLDTPHMQRFLRYPIGRHRSVKVFDLRPFQGPGWRAPRPWGKAGVAS